MKYNNIKKHMIELKSLDQWQDLLKQSNEKPIIIFKHSITCPISASAYQKIIQAENDKTISELIYIVIVQKNREVSNKIAKDLKIWHQSPQVIIVKNKIAVYNTSHNEIDPTKMLFYLK